MFPEIVALFDMDIKAKANEILAEIKRESTNNQD